MQRMRAVSLADLALVLLLTFSVLWKGGKSLEATWLLVLVVGFCVFRFWQSRSKEQPAVSPLVWWSAMGFVCLSVVSFVTSSTQNYGLDEVLREGSLMLLLFWCARRALLKEKMQESFVELCLWIVAMLAILAAEIGVLVYVFQPVNRMVGTFFDFRFQTDYWPNAWAQFLLLAWPAAIWRLHHARATPAKLAWILGAGFLFGSLLLSYSRGALIALAGQLVLFSIFLLMAYVRQRASVLTRIRHWFHHGSRVMIFGYIIIPVLAVGIFSGVNILRSSFFDIQDVSDKLAFTASEGTSSKTERVQFWQQATQLTLQKPLTGWGPYSFRFVQPRVQQGVLATSDHPHNVLLKLSMERGILAAILFLLLLCAIVLPALRKQFHAKSAFDPRPLMLIGVLGVLAHNMIDYNLQFVGIALPFMIFLGFLAANPDAASSQKLHVRAEILVMSVLMIVAVLEARLLVLSSLGRHAQAAGQTQEALAWYELSERSWFPRDMELSRAQLLLDEKKFQESGLALERYRHKNAEDYRVYKELGVLAQHMDQPEDADNFYRTAYASAKYNDVSVVNALLNLSGGTYPAENEVITLAKQYRDALLMNAHFIALSPNAESFDLLMDLLMNIYPQQAADFKAMESEVNAHVLKERSAITARQPGFLW